MKQVHKRLSMQWLWVRFALGGRIYLIFSCYMRKKSKFIIILINIHFFSFTLVPTYVSHTARMVEGTLCQHHYIARFHLEFKILCAELWIQQNCGLWMQHTMSQKLEGNSLCSPQRDLTVGSLWLSHYTRKSLKLFLLLSTYEKLSIIKRIC